jgi:tripartite-type tricarboxylate transporter receptor subunit TctC
MNNSRLAQVRLSSALVAALALLTGQAMAQSGAYPTRPIRLVVALPPGGAPDYISRLVAERLQGPLGQPVVVENRPGAGGNLAVEAVVRQNPDGYTLLMGDTAQVLNQSFFVKLPYDVLKDLEPVALVGLQPFVLAVGPKSPVRTLNDLITLARAKPGELTYGTAGIGSPHHFGAEWLKSMTGINIVHVPYKGAAGIMPALISGEISFSIGGMYSTYNQIKGGKLRAIAVTGRERTPVMPDLPTFAEAGPLPGYAFDTWFGVLAAAGTPQPVIERLNTELNRISRDPQWAKEKLYPLGLQPLSSTPQRFREVMESDLATYAKIAKAANIRPE